MKKLNFSPFPILETDQFTLRKLSVDDVEEIYISRSDQRVVKYLDIPIAKDKEEALKFINKINSGIDDNEWILWAICYKSDPKLIGTICLWNLDEDKNKADIGFVLLPNYHGKGIIKEVILDVLEFGFNVMNLQIIEGEADPNNIKSIAILKRNGFIFNRRLENSQIYSLSRKAYKGFK